MNMRVLLGILSCLLGAVMLWFSWYAPTITENYPEGDLRFWATWGVLSVSGGVLFIWRSREKATGNDDDPK